MKNLFEVTTLNELKNRLTRLSAESKRQWGKMNAAQMLAHCSEWMEVAAGQTSPPRSWMGYMFGRLAKRSVLSDAPIRRNMPTDRSLVVNDERDERVGGLISHNRTFEFYTPGVSRQVGAEQLNPQFGGDTPELTANTSTLAV